MYNKILAAWMVVISTGLVCTTMYAWMRHGFYSVSGWLCACGTWLGLLVQEMGFKKTEEGWHEKYVRLRGRCEKNIKDYERMSAEVQALATKLRESETGKLRVALEEAVDMLTSICEFLTAGSGGALMSDVKATINSANAVLSGAKNQTGEKHDGLR